VRFMLPTMTPSLSGHQTARKGDTHRPAAQALPQRLQALQATPLP